jgi:hypothetical protein
MNKVPAVGSRVEVVTKHPDSYIDNVGQFAFYSYKGIVVRPYIWMKNHQFNVETGNPNWPISTIDISNVHSLKVLEATKPQDNFRRFKVVSKSSGKEYIVTKTDNGFECSCPGFSFRGKCKHSDAVRAKIKE